MRKRSTQSSCQICQKAIDARQARTAKTCSSWRCRHKLRDIERANRAEESTLRRERYDAKVNAATDERNKSESQVSPRDYQVVVTPANERPLKPLPRSRKYRFAKRIIKTVKSALRESPELNEFLTANTASINDQEEVLKLPVFGGACGNCGGKCCGRGGTGAFISPSTINRFRRLHPTASEEEIVNAYCTLIPDRSHEGSCVFHSETGCTLPQIMRSDTCNNMICGGLVELYQSITLDAQKKFFIAACNRDGVQRAKWIDIERADEDVRKLD